MNPSRKLLLCLSTVASAEDAERIAAALIAQSLAACVQIEGPIRSHYRWQGQTQCDQEYRLVIKSAVTVWEQLKSKLIDLHPYDEPQIVMIEIDDASDGYRDWVFGTDRTRHVLTAREAASRCLSRCELRSDLERLIGGGGLSQPERILTRGRV